jgi:hypothetical protein
MLSLSPLSLPPTRRLCPLSGEQHDLPELATHSGRWSSFFLAYDSQETGAAFLLRYPVYRMGYRSPVQPVLGAV